MIGNQEFENIGIIHLGKNMYVTVDSKQIQRQLNRVHISKRDFEETADYVNSYNKNYSDTIKRALLSAAIIAYARPFKGNKGPKDRSIPTLPKGWLKNLDNEHRKLHRRILDLRDKAVAHSEYGLKPTSPTVCDSGVVVQCSRPFDILAEDLDFFVFQSNIQHMIKYTIDKIYELNKKIV